ncbi:uncharacterized protein LOC142608984 [Castanea sativa]|uniref:uncharacterized protein LOC142608984 n=1 Tax=Castanea sativa TaxID=21020 RepID=UPI003F64EE26
MIIDERRITAEPTEVLEDVPLDKSNPKKFTRIGTSMEKKTKQDLVQFLKKSLDVFAWSHENMPGGIEANTNKIQAILNMEPPKNIKEVQSLTNRIVALNKFVSKAIDKCLPFFKVLRKTFEWTDECQKVFQDLKTYLITTPLLSLSILGEELYLYLAVSLHAVSSALIRKEGRIYKLVYYMSRALRGAEGRYPMMEKLAFALVTTSKKLRHYFQAHVINILTDYPLKKFIPSQGELDKEEGAQRWVINVDGSFTLYAGGIGVILKSSEGDKLEYIVHLQYQTINNEAEYEALLKGLELAKTLGENSIVVQGDSQLVINQVNGMCESKEDQMKKYLNKANGQAEVANWSSLKIIETRLEGAKGVWPDELPSVLWAYRTTMKTPTRETPFKLAYGSEAVIPAKVHMANHRVMKYQDEDNEDQLCLSLNLIDEVWMDAEQMTARYKNLMARQYDTMVKPRRFNIGDLVLKRVSFVTKNLAHEKLGPNWEGPYRVINCKRQGLYYLEALDGRKLKCPWNVEHLRRYYQ